MKKIILSLLAFATYSCADAQLQAVPKFVKSAPPIGVPRVTLGVAFNGKYYYNLAGDLWMSDGTDAGTVMIKDLNPTVSGTNILAMKVVNGKLFMIADDGVHDIELWTSDGTTGGTAMVKELNTSGDGIYQTTFSDYSLVALNNNVFFYGNDGSGVELWKSDGTATGTQMVKDINTQPGADIINISGTFAYNTVCCLATVNNKVFFTADDGISGPELWVTDGTATGTNLVKDIYTGSIPGGIPPSYFLPYNNQLVFIAGNSTGNYSIYVTDGTATGTVELLYNTYFFQTDHIVYNNKLYFLEVGGGLYSTDGTPGGTQIVKNVGMPWSNFPNAPCGGFMTNYNNKIYFTGTTVTNGDAELYVSDGTNAGTQLIKDLIPYGKGVIPNFSSSPAFTLNFGGKLYMRALDTNNKNDIWVSDGTGGGTKRVAYPTVDASGPVGVMQLFLNKSPLTIVGNTMFYWNYYNATEGIALYKLDVFADDVAGLEKDEAMTVYPNPATKTIHLGTTDASNITVYNTVGSVVLRSKLNADHTVNIEALTPGIYHAILSDANGVQQHVKFQKL